MVSDSLTDAPYAAAEPFAKIRPCRSPVQIAQRPTRSIQPRWAKRGGRSVASAAAMCGLPSTAGRCGPSRRRTGRMSAQRRQILNRLAPSRPAPKRPRQPTPSPPGQPSPRRRSPKLPLPPKCRPIRRARRRPSPPRSPPPRRLSRCTRTNRSGIPISGTSKSRSPAAPGASRRAGVGDCRGPDGPPRSWRWSRSISR